MSQKVRAGVSLPPARPPTSPNAAGMPPTQSHDRQCVGSRRVLSDRVNSSRILSPIFASVTKRVARLERRATESAPARARLFFWFAEVGDRIEHIRRHLLYDR